jgi:hypothetical protein
MHRARDSLAAAPLTHTTSQFQKIFNALEKAASTQPEDASGCGGTLLGMLALWMCSACHRNTLKQTVCCYHHIKPTACCDGKQEEQSDALQPQHHPSCKDWQLLPT